MATRDRLLFASTSVMLVTWFLFGGDAPNRFLSLGVLGLAGTLQLAAVTLSGGWRRLIEQRWTVRLFVVAVLLTPLLQMIPLPPSLWHALPGRELPTATLAMVGEADRWRPLTLSVTSTLETALMCLWLLGLGVGITALSIARQRHLCILLFAAAMVNIAIGLVQVLSGGEVLDFYNSSHRGLLLGMFANKNHSGLFIALAFLTGYAAFRQGAAGGSTATRRLSPIVVIPVAVVMFAALLASNSRAALLFGVFSLGFTLLMASRHRVGNRGRLAVLIVLGVVSAIGMFSSSDIAERSLGRFGTVDSDMRWLFWTRSWPLVTTYFPAGAGIGSFPTLFNVIERLDWLEPTYLNHAHNDYLEQLTEIGVGAPLLWVLFLMAAIPALISAWRSQRTEGGMALLGGAIVFLFLVHSGFDYPLRRPGTAMMFVVGLAMLFRQAPIQTVAPSYEVCEGPRDGIRSAP